MNKQLQKQEKVPVINRKSKPYGVIKLIECVEHYLMVDHHSQKRAWSQHRDAATGWPTFNDARTIAGLTGGLVVDLSKGDQSLLELES